MSNFFYRYKKPIIFITIILIFTIIIYFTTTFIVKNISLKNTKITISNFNQVITKNLTFNRQLSFYEYLHQTLINQNNLSPETEISDIVIRENTVSETSYNNDSITYSFIIDIDSLKQSYYIENFSLSKTEPPLNSATINCPAIQDSKYPTTFCQGMYNNTITATIDKFIPAPRNLNLTYPYLITYNPTVQNGLLITPETCENNIPALATQDTLTWLKSLGLTSFLDQINITTTCGS